MTTAWRYWKKEGKLYELLGSMQGGRTRKAGIYAR